MSLEKVSFQERIFYIKKYCKKRSSNDINFMINSIKSNFGKNKINLHLN